MPDSKDRLLERLLDDLRREYPARRIDLSVIPAECRGCGRGLVVHEIKIEGQSAPQVGRCPFCQRTVYPCVCWAVSVDAIDRT